MHFSDAPSKVDFDSLKSLSDDGIDMSFLDSLKKEYEDTDPEKQLQDIADLLHVRWFFFHLFMPRTEFNSFLFPNSP